MTKTKLNTYNPYISYFRKELKLADGKMTSFVLKCIPEIESILQKAEDDGWSGGVAPFFISSISKTIERALNFQTLTPLRFTDDEWSENFSLNDDVKQNLRDSSIFKRGNIITDNYGMTHKYSKRYDVSKNELENYNCNSSWTGGIMFYDSDNDRWIDMQRVKVINMKDFMCQNRVVIDTIELYDSTDTHNDFITHIANLKSIPSNFYKDYEIIERTVHNKEYEYVIAHPEFKKLVM